MEASVLEMFGTAEPAPDVADVCMDVADEEFGFDLSALEDAEFNELIVYATGVESDAILNEPDVVKTVRNAIADRLLGMAHRGGWIDDLLNGTKR